MIINELFKLSLFQCKTTSTNISKYSYLNKVLKDIASFKYCLKNMEYAL